MPAELPEGFRDGYLEANGVRLHYVEAGEGEPILFLHGFPQFWWLWRSQLAEFSRDHRAVAPDMRGYNLSDAPAGVDAYRMRELIGDVDALVAELGRPLTLVGHDWGGIVAWAYALKRSERLARLVVLDAPPPFTWGRELERSARQRAAVRYMTDLARPAPYGEELLGANDFRLLDGLVVDPGIQRGYLTEEDRERYHQAWAEPGSLSGPINYYRASGMGDQVTNGQPAEARRHLESLRLELPTLVIWGAEDHALLPRLTSGLDRWVPGVRVEILDGAGHWTPQERPAEVNALIREFLASS